VAREEVVMIFGLSHSSTGQVSVTGSMITSSCALFAFIFIVLCLLWSRSGTADDGPDHYIHPPLLRIDKFNPRYTTPKRNEDFLKR
jgi:hypothetical protein